jgi:hypothetical protein
VRGTTKHCFIQHMGHPFDKFNVNLASTIPTPRGCSMLIDAPPSVFRAQAIELLFVCWQASNLRLIPSSFGKNEPCFPVMSTRRSSGRSAIINKI